MPSAAKEPRLPRLPPPPRLLPSGSSSSSPSSTVEKELEMMPSPGTKFRPEGEVRYAEKYLRKKGEGERSG